jgi:uncharacterized protein YqeY
MGCKLEETIQRDLVAAMKNHDERRMTALRMLKTSIQLASSEKGRGELADEDIHVLVRRGLKQREEAAEIYARGGASDRAEEELAEARVLAAYLPAQLDDAELERVISGVISSLCASGPKDTGRVMGSAMKETVGRADGKRVKGIVARLLA